MEIELLTPGEPQYVTVAAGTTDTDGQVSDLYKHISFSTLNGRKLRLYYRADGSKTWHLSQHARVANDGYFTFSTAKSYGYRMEDPVSGPSAGVRSDGVGTSPSAVRLAKHRGEFGVGHELPDLLRTAAGDGDLDRPFQRLFA